MKRVTGDEMILSEESIKYLAYLMICSVAPHEGQLRAIYSWCFAIKISPKCLATNAIFEFALDKIICHVGSVRQRLCSTPSTEHAETVP